MRASSVVMLVSLLLTSCAFSGSMASSNVRDVASTGLRPSQPLAIVPTDRGPATIAADGSVRRPYHLLRCYTTAQCCTIVGPDTGATCDETDDSPVPIPDLSVDENDACPSGYDLAFTSTDASAYCETDGANLPVDRATIIAVRERLVVSVRNGGGIVRRFECSVGANSSINSFVLKKTKTSDLGAKELDMVRRLSERAALAREDDREPGTGLARAAGPELCP